ncbi:unnamed protein product [Hermetia illucens]|uniref:Uncharacterized protein n=2 Tax=Hermetia illucens TaxID=343691 RepID=A0A7R8YYJ9_HERIL|nr:unnamed protein product [Hermetia illucens]
MSKMKGGAKKPVKPMPATIENSNFDLELCWCIQQLQNSLQSGKLSEREAERIDKAIKTLKSPKEVFIKKRQLMQQLLGDYREKMKKEEKKHSIAANQFKFTTAKPSKKSHFVKKSAFATPGSDFKFDFAVDQIDKLDITDSTSKKEEENGKSIQAEPAEKFQYVPSGNTFRFAFNINEEEKGGLS